jgi:putative photosynthetic complex assembly protein
MSGEFTNERFPKSALYAAGALIAISIVTVGCIRLGVLPAPETAPQSRERRQVAVQVAREFRFEDRADGALLVTDVAAGRLVFIFPPGSNTGFIRGVMRGLAYHRSLKGAPAAAPFELSVLSNGALILFDPQTERRIDLGAFGVTNRAAFAAMLDAGASPQT